MDDASSNRGKKSYYLLVNEELLVNVGRGPIVEKSREDSKLLSAIKESFISSNQKFSPHRKSFKSSDHFLRDLLEGKQEELLEQIQALSLNITLKEGKYNLFHFCALGGFLNCFKYLKEIKLPENRFASSTYLQLAAHGGYLDFLEYLKNDIRLDAIMRALPTARYFRHSKFEHALIRMYKEEKTRLQSAAPSIGYPRATIDYSDVYPVPSLQAVIPSLFTICVHVVVAEIINNPLPCAPSLASLPPSVFEQVLLKIADDSQKGYTTLTQLQGIELGKQIPTVAWVTAIQAMEKTAREFSFRGYNIVDKFFPVPIIDVYANYDTFVLAPPDEFEKNCTTYFPQTKGEPGTPSIVPREQFLKQFKAFTAGMLEGFEFPNIVVVGGSIVASLMPIPSLGPDAKETDIQEYYNLEPYKTSDIDLYNGGPKKDGLQNFAISAVHAHVAKKIGDPKLTLERSVGNQFVVHPLFPYRNIQSTENTPKSVSEILSTVDVDCCAFAFDGKTLWASPRARMAVNHRWNIVNPDVYKIRGTPQYELKLAKYAQRGFSIIDREVHLYETLKEEPKISKEMFLSKTIAKHGPTLWGAGLISAMAQWPSVLRAMLQIENDCRIPYGKDVGENQVYKHFYTVLNKPKSHIGYGQVYTPGPVQTTHMYFNSGSQGIKIDPYIPKLPLWYEFLQNGEMPTKYATRYQFYTSFYVNEEEFPPSYDQDLSELQRLLKDMLIHGRSLGQFIKDFPTYTQNEIEEALEYLERKNHGSGLHFKYAEPQHF